MGGMEVLVVGLRRRGSGKTTVARALREVLGGDVFKPLAASHAWRDWSTMVEGLPEGLYGSDAAFLARDSGRDVYGVNPVHRVWVPRPASRGGGDAWGMDRVWTGDDIVAVVNRSVDLPGPLAAFVEGCDGVVEVDGLGDPVFRELHPGAVESAYDSFRDDVVVESYSDAAVPFSGLEPDVVLAVEPFRLHLLDGEGFVKACGLLRGRYAELGRDEVRVGRVLELESPEVSVELPVVRDPSSLESVVEAYGSVLREFLGEAVATPPRSPGPSGT